jgi:5-methylcytosine-specific restriction endonuclease McrA
MHQCPSCNESFETRRGLGVHHSVTHDEQLPNRTCDHCGTEFHSSYQKRYCSDGCLDSAVSFEGENHPNWDGGKQSTTCDICSSEFEYYPSEKEGLYCSTCVERERWRHEPDIEKENNPRWTGGKQELECDNCDANIVRRQSNITGDHVFCSDDCQYEWLSETFTGEGHPNWKGGANVNYGQGWRRVRERALERDGRECVICGTTKEELGRNPDVHHIIPVRAFVETPVTAVFDAHYLENVVSLCPSCHRQAEFGTISPERLRSATP